MYRQSPSAPRRTISLAEPPRCTCSPSGPVPSIDQSSTIWAISPATNTWRALAFSGRPRLISRSNRAAISVRSVMVRPSFAITTASGSYKPIIALTLPELNRSSSDATMPSGSVGSEYDSDIRGLLFVLVELRCGDDTHVVAWTTEVDEPCELALPVNQLAAQNFAPRRAPAAWRGPEQRSVARRYTLAAPDSRPAPGAGSPSALFRRRECWRSPWQDRDSRTVISY